MVGTPVEIICGGHRHPVRTGIRETLLEHVHQPSRIPVRQGPKQQRMIRTEDRCIGSDAQRHDQQRRNAEPRISAHLPQTVQQVLSQIVDPMHPAGLAALLLSLLQPTQRNQRGPASVVRAHTARPILLRLPLDVIP